MNNNKLVFITIALVAAAMILATVVPTEVSADRSSGQQGIIKARESSNPRSSGGLNEASSHTCGDVFLCPVTPGR